MYSRNEFIRALTIVAAGAFGASLTLAGCGDRKSTAPVSAPAPSAPANTAAPAPTTTAPTVPAGSGSEVTKKGTETGMIGGEAGTAASDGKPGSGTNSNAGTGAAQSSDGKTSDKK